jgi:hypothetical protein
MKTRRIVGTISLSEIVHKSGLRGEKATFPLLIEQLISSTRQRQTLARLSRDLHRKSVVPIVQSLTAVQNSKVQSDLEAGSNTSSRFKRSIASRSSNHFLASCTYP